MLLSFKEANSSQINSGLISQFEKICEMASKQTWHNGLSIDGYRHILFIHGNDRRAYLMERQSDGTYKRVRIPTENGQFADYWLIAPAKLGFSKTERTGRTPTGLFIARESPFHRTFFGRSIGNTPDAETMWSVMLLLYGIEKENVNTASRFIGLHGTSLSHTVLNRKFASHGCIRFLAFNTQKSSVFLQKGYATIEHLYKIVSSDEKQTGLKGIPVFIYVSPVETKMPLKSGSVVLLSKGSFSNQNKEDIMNKKPIKKIQIQTPEEID